MADVMQDSASHTEISATLGRNVAKPLLEKTFHMKIQSRKVFKQREAFERMINESEDRTTKSHIEYRKSWTGHVEQQDPHSLAKYLDAQRLRRTDSQYQRNDRLLLRRMSPLPAPGV